MSDRIPFRTSPMLATLVDAPVRGAGWVFEEKYDGYRVLAYKEGPRVEMVSRTGRPCADRFPALASALRELPARTIVLDGEAVVFDEERVSRFHLLQRRQGTERYAIFDCLWRDGVDLRSTHLPRRRLAARSAIRGSSRLFLAHRLARSGPAAHRVAERLGLEGWIAKDPDAPYRPGRSRRWLKVKLTDDDDFVIGGFTPGLGTRSHFGALLLGAYLDGELHYVGKVGTGLDEAALASIGSWLRALERRTPPFVHPPSIRTARWVTPVLVAEVRYGEWTADGLLRHPVFRRLRDDKPPRECRLARTR